MGLQCFFLKVNLSRRATVHVRYDSSVKFRTLVMAVAWRSSWRPDQHDRPSLFELCSTLLISYQLVENI